MPRNIQLRRPPLVSDEILRETWAALWSDSGNDCRKALLALTHDIAAGRYADLVGDDFTPVSALLREETPEVKRAREKAQRIFRFALGGGAVDPRGGPTREIVRLREPAELVPDEPPDDEQ